MNDTPSPSLPNECLSHHCRSGHNRFRRYYWVNWTIKNLRIERVLTLESLRFFFLLLRIFVFDFLFFWLLVLRTDASSVNSVPSAVKGFTGSANELDNTEEYYLVIPPPNRWVWNPSSQHHGVYEWSRNHRVSQRHARASQGLLWQCLEFGSCSTEGIWDDP